MQSKLLTEHGLSHLIFGAGYNFRSQTSTAADLNAILTVMT